MPKSLLSWSGGKDSALTLYELQQTDTPQIVALLTTVTEDYDRISMHGVRRDLLEQQAARMGYPLEKALIPKDCSNDDYGRIMTEVLERYKAKGVRDVVFGDLFLEDIRSYREGNLEKIGMKGVFPLWEKDTGELARSFVHHRFKAVVVCVDTEALDGDFVGREYDGAFLDDLPEEVDPCGENGEFHTFVYDGPIFSEPIEVVRGEKVLRDERFYFCDLMAAHKEYASS